MRPIVITPEARAQVGALVSAALRGLGSEVPVSVAVNAVAYDLLDRIVGVVNGQPVNVHADTVEIVDSRPDAPGVPGGDKPKMQRPYTDDQLRYAATQRCLCGAGFAYPLDCDLHGSWECSDILTGRVTPADGKVHTSPLPFTFYEVKSEGQASAQGATTRPAATGMPGAGS